MKSRAEDGNALSNFEDVLELLPGYLWIMFENNLLFLEGQKKYYSEKKPFLRMDITRYYLR